MRELIFHLNVATPMTDEEMISYIEQEKGVSLNHLLPTLGEHESPEKFIHQKVVVTLTVRTEQEFKW